MPPAKKFQPASFRLTDKEKIDLAKLANILGKNQADVARDAIRWYVENHQKISNKEKDDRVIDAIFKSTDRIIAVLQKCTERIASLQVRAIIDNNITMMLFYRMLPANDADKIIATMYRMAISRVMRKLPPEELKISSMIREGMEQEIFEEAFSKKTPSKQTDAEHLRKAS